MQIAKKRLTQQYVSFDSALESIVVELKQCLLEVHGQTDRPEELVVEANGTEVCVRAFGYAEPVVGTDMRNLENRLQLIEASSRDAGNDISINCYFNGMKTNTAGTISGHIGVRATILRAEKRRDGTKQ